MPILGCMVLLAGLAFGQDVKPAVVRAREIVEPEVGHVPLLVLLLFLRQTMDAERSRHFPFQRDQVRYGPMGADRQGGRNGIYLLSDEAS